MVRLGLGLLFSAWGLGSTFVVLEPDTMATEAEAAAPARFEGEFRYRGGAAEIERARRAVDEVVASMNFIMRPIARKRLHRAAEPAKELSIEVRANTIHVRRPGVATVAAPADGTFVSWTARDGDEFQVRHRFLNARTLVQEFVGDGNRAVNTYVLSPDGSRVEMRTSIDADLLPSTLRYAFTYRRAKASEPAP